MSGLAALAAGFDRALRAHGVLAGTRRAQTFADVLSAMPPCSRAGLYWRARTAMLPAIEDLAAFEAAVDEFFGADAPGSVAGALDVGLPAAPRPPALRRETLAPPPSDEPAGARAAAAAPVQWLTASPDERLLERAFDAFGPAEQATMLRLIAGARVAAELRRSRRRRRDRHGDRIDLRASLREAPRSAGELVRRHRTRPRERVRPLVFLIDVSGSMEPFARALIAYARVVTIARPAVRTFAFATRLSELTAVLRSASSERLFAAIAAAVPDFGGGTRIGAALRSFNDRYAQRGIARGGSVVILSDGWERDDPACVGAEMARLRRLSRRIVWINPQKRHAAYEPLVRGMAAALPSIDVLLSGHNVRTLEGVAAAVEGGATSGKRSAVGATRRRSALSNRAVPDGV